MRFNPRLPLLMLAGGALLTALWAGLVRLGWRLPPLATAAHGPLMLSGFLGTVISLERAAALASVLNARWTYAAPLAAGLSGLALILGLPNVVSQGLSVLASLGLTLGFILICRRQLTWPHVTMGVGALLWLLGNLRWWQTHSIAQAAPAWIGFLVFTIAGERLELARVLVWKRPALAAFLLSAGVLLGGLLMALFSFRWGIRTAGVGLMLVGVWLLRYDLAVRILLSRQTGLTRFIAACLAPGYVWLVFAGGLWLTFPDYFAAGPIYDAMLHALALGFVFSMIFGHEPIIVPALLNVGLTYSPAFYLHLALLHLSLLLRVVGDLAFIPSLRLWGGLLNVIAILLFMGNTVRAVRRAAASHPGFAGPAQGH
jgi:hypothetical protein